MYHENSKTADAENSNKSDNYCIQNNSLKMDVKQLFNRSFFIKYLKQISELSRRHHSHKSAATVDGGGGGGGRGGAS